ncbi:hypothetical protein D3C81_1299770 [compost metagenome]
MAEAGDHAPARGGRIGADPHRVAFHQAAVLRGQVGHQRRVVGLARAQLFLAVGIGQAMQREVRGGRVAARAGAGAGAGAHHARAHVVAQAHPQPHAEALAQPVRQADVVGVAVGHQHAHHRQPFEFVGEDGFPVRLDGVVGNAAVDDGPALAPIQAVAQQPQVDMVERERQRHAQPVDARGDFLLGAGLGHGVAERVLELVFECVHEESLVRSLVPRRVRWCRAGAGGLSRCLARGRNVPARASCQSPGLTLT